MTGKVKFSNPAAFACLSAAILLPLLSGCVRTPSAVGVNSVVEAMKIEAAGSAGSGTVMPNLVIGGAVSHISVLPVLESEKGKTLVGQRVFQFTRRSSIFGEIWGSLDSSTLAVTYTGAPGETPEETKTVLESAAQTVRAAGGSGISRTERNDKNTPGEK